MQHNTCNAECKKETAAYHAVSFLFPVCTRNHQSNYSKQNKQTRARIKINNLIYHRIKQYSFKEITVFNKLFY